ncbi:MAG: hypothetical protein ACI9IV_001282 [Paracoccaceae bacterium]|jgi:hypothetical protein
MSVVTRIRNAGLMITIQLHRTNIQAQIKPARHCAPPLFDHKTALK